MFVLDISGDISDAFIFSVLVKLRCFRHLCDVNHIAPW